MCSDSLAKWLFFGYRLVVAVLNATIILALGLSLNHDYRFGDSINPNVFQVAGIILQLMSLAIKALDVVIKSLKFCSQVAKPGGAEKSCVEKILLCVEIIMFLVVYIGNIVMLIINAMLLGDLVDQDVTLFVISLVSFVMLCLIQSIFLLTMFVYCLKKKCCEEEEKDPLLS